MGVDDCNRRVYTLVQLNWSLTCPLCVCQCERERVCAPMCGLSGPDCAFRLAGVRCGERSAVMLSKTQLQSHCEDSDTCHAAADVAMTTFVSCHP